MADTEQVIIIGSGPAGYTAALYTARADLSPLVIEGFLWGGLLQQTTEVENYPGFRDGIMGPELMQTMRDQAERFGARYLTDNATRFEPAAEEGGLHTVWVGDDEYKARTVILAMGAEHKKLGVPGEEELANGRGVSYCATCDAAFFKDKETIIVGGGDSAMEEAIFLAKFSSKVTIVHRRDEFRASQIMFDRAKAIENIELLTPYVVEEFLPAEGGAARLGPRAQHRDRRGARAADGRRVRRGRPRAAVGDRRRASSTTDENGYVLVDGRSTRTDVPGVFAAGDLVDHTYRQAITAAGHRAARRRSTPSGTCATTRTCRRRPRSRAPATSPRSSGSTTSRPRAPSARRGGSAGAQRVARVEQLERACRVLEADGGVERRRLAAARCAPSAARFAPPRTGRAVDRAATAHAARLACRTRTGRGRRRSARAAGAACARRAPSRGRRRPGPRRSRPSRRPTLGRPLDSGGASVAERAPVDVADVVVGLERVVGRRLPGAARPAGSARRSRSRSRSRPRRRRARRGARPGRPGTA